MAKFKIDITRKIDHPWDFDILLKKVEPEKPGEVVFELGQPKPLSYSSARLTWACPLYIPNTNVDLPIFSGVYLSRFGSEIYLSVIPCTSFAINDLARYGFSIKCENKGMVLMRNNRGTLEFGILINKISDVE